MAQKAEAALEPWLEEAMERKMSIFGGKLEVLKGCRDKNNDELLDLHLCPVTKYQYGDASPRGYWDHDCDDARRHSMHEVEEASIEFERWIGLDDRPAHAFKDLEIDMETVVVGKGENPFGSEADERGYEGHAANSGSTLELWYQTAMLVVWPQARSISIAFEAGVHSALNLLKKT
ncbi:unnamed protein product [Calypogeia fissa]